MNSADMKRAEHSALAKQRQAEAAEQTGDYWLAVAFYNEAADLWDMAKNTEQGVECRAHADRLELKVRR